MINELKLKFPKIQEIKIILEAGHIYTNEEPNDEHRESVKYGKLLENYFSMFGAGIERWLFVDNYNPQFEDNPEILNIGHYINLLANWEFPPEKIVYEADLVEQAHDVLSYLQRNNYALKNDKDKILLYKDKILLYDIKTEKYMCTLLDACLYLNKLEQADCCVTILNQQYSHQQKGTLTILKKLDVEIEKIFPFFYPTPGKSIQPPLYPHIYSEQKTSFVKPVIDLLKIIEELSGSFCGD